MQESNKIKKNNKFKPQPGDKIICNNGEEFICCTLEFLRETIYEGTKSDKPILGYRKFGYEEEWQHGGEDGYASLAPDNDYDIREVIPQSSEVTADKKEEVKEEPRYTVEEVIEAFSNALHLSWMGGHKEGIEKVKDYLEKKSNKEYQEYLRLKAIYE